MKKKIIYSVLVFFQIIAAQSVVFAQKEPQVKISGEVATPYVLKLSDFGGFERTEVTRKDRDGKDHQYSGVLLYQLLAKAGTTLGKDLRGENLTKYAFIEASDGYQVVFALAELDPEFTDKKIILADKIDENLLAAADGPFRIIVQDEKKPARCMKQVTEIKIGFAK
ncbi:molybdopterin-binding protein [Pedobacter sp. AW1-32]|uniref:molybdopterin-dependent oxidoreductase n=1 Tax=Pedobacter sp. AW1-32 TaxID=3383026 RepID=UPI003FEE0620